jgi:hypothetical protein
MSPLVTSSAVAEVSVGIGIGLPRVSIGINLSSYPRLVRVPGYPVYYAPTVHANFFFYDGMYWVFHDDNWYASSWYNGPWAFVRPDYVPAYILRVPVRYYRQPPNYFRGWRADAPPRWSNNFGRDWDKGDRRAAPPAAPPPAYQRQYSGDRYPRQVERQRELEQQQYRYQPRDPAVQQHYQDRGQSQKSQNQGRGQDRNKDRGR